MKTWMKHPRMKHLPYTIHKLDIPATNIFNLTDPGLLPEAVAIVGNNWWDSHYDELRNEIRSLYIRRMDELTQHYTLLRQSIQTSGFINPIVVTRGGPKLRKRTDLPPTLQDNSTLMICEYLGGSRLSIAQEMNTIIPCIVSDFTKTLKDNRLQSIEEIKSLFSGAIDVQMPPTGVRITPRNFIHIPDGSYNMNTQVNKRRLVVDEIKQFTTNWIKHNGRK